MPEYLKFEIGGYLEGYTQIRLTLRNKCIYCKYNIGNLQRGVKILSEEVSFRWICKLHNIGIYNWQTDYRPKDLICDGTQWSLEYKEFHFPHKSICGDNEYPPNFMDFLRVMEELVPEARLVPQEEELADE